MISHNLLWRLWSFGGDRRFRRVAYSQEGEDLILDRIFARKRSGFYVDVGAHHPHRYSNTFLFYLRGWRGINVDPLPGTKALFDKLRPRDINLELAVLRDRRCATYFEFNDPAVNGFDAHLVNSRESQGRYRLLRTTERAALPLREILATYLPIGTVIDFLSVDVEGMDLEVLESNDWERYRPRVVLAEIRGSSLSSITSDPVHVFMRNQGYDLFAKSMQTVFFVRED